VAELEAELVDNASAAASPACARANTSSPGIRPGAGRRRRAVVLDGVLAVGGWRRSRRRAVLAAVEAAVDDDACSQAGADGEPHQVAVAAAGAEVQLAHGEGVGVRC
jgi:hypothetical protein